MLHESKNNSNVAEIDISLFTVIDIEFSLEVGSPDQPLKTYPFCAVAVKSTDAPELKLPPEVFTEPPCEADTVRVNF